MSKKCKDFHLCLELGMVVAEESIGQHPTEAQSSD